MRSATLLLLLLMGYAQAKDSERPKVTAYFDRVDDGPAFFVECRNTTGKTLSSSTADWPGIWPGTVRVDGVVPPEEMILGPGLSQDVACRSPKLDRRNDIDFQQPRGNNQPTCPHFYSVGFG